MVKSANSSTPLERRINNVRNKVYELHDLREQIEYYRDREAMLAREWSNIEVFELGDEIGLTFCEDFRYDKEVFERIRGAIMSIIKSHISNLEDRMEEILPQSIWKDLEDMWESIEDAQHDSV